MSEHGQGSASPDQERLLVRPDVQAAIERMAPLVLPAVTRFCDHAFEHPRFGSRRSSAGPQDAAVEGVDGYRLSDEFAAAHGIVVARRAEAAKDN